MQIVFCKKKGTIAMRILNEHINDLFILPIKNGNYAILQGDGYVDVPEITTALS